MKNLISLGIINKNNKAVVSSRIVSENFNKEHSNILKTISGETRKGKHINGLVDGIIQSGGNPRDYFIESEYTDSKNRKYPEYLLTRDGFSLLVMGFTGQKALEWKLKYIQAFNAMENFIKEKLSSEWQETRIKGKLARRNETDVIMDRLIPLAISQGSKNAGKLYMTYSKLVNNCVGIASNSRDKATKRVLDVIYNLENLIEHVIKEEVEKETYYKDIYQICKGKCKLLVELSYLPEQKMISSNPIVKINKLGLPVISGGGKTMRELYKDVR
ncbi:Rha family transcriptional regulator [Hathewaya massiliensis]|uniref:Rha family transcriptional regulator n=1 Tax=Hathewaya massiliensis TaxID=1964382 RepID=UPI001158E42A|nr:Rha family transcriptional regulator [Hathewaya massiliensis]